MDENNLTYFEPVDTLLINDADALKLLADPFRSRILDLLRSEVHTAKELAQTLNLSPKKLYYHLKLMEEKGLIRIVSTRIVSGIIEKSYRATAYLFLFDGDGFRTANPEQSALPPGLHSVYETTRTQMEMSFADGLIDMDEGAPIGKQMLWAWGLQRLSAAKAEEFYTRFAALIDEFDCAKPLVDEGELQDYRLFMTVFPVKAFLKSPKKERIE